MDAAFTTCKVSLTFLITSADHLVAESLSLLTRLIRLVIRIFRFLHRIVIGFPQVRLFGFTIY